MTEDDDEGGFGGLYEDGHWVWDESTEELVFLSDLLPQPIEPVQIAIKAPTGAVEFRDDVDLIEQIRFRRRYQRKLIPGQADIVTLQDIKDIALYTAPVNILSPMLINMLHLPTTERFLRALILCSAYYLQVADQMTNRILELDKKVRTPNCELLENAFRENLSDLRTLVAKEYCVMLIGGGDTKKFHHMGPTKKRRSLSDKDARLFETLLRMSVQIVWLALGRKSFHQIEAEKDQLGNLVTKYPFLFETSHMKYKNNVAKILSGTNKTQPAAARAASLGITIDCECRQRLRVMRVLPASAACICSLQPRLEWHLNGVYAGPFRSVQSHCNAELETNRIFKSAIFNSVEHTLKTGYISKMVPEERAVLLGPCVRHDKKLNTRSPLINEVFCHRDIDYRLMGLGVIKCPEITTRLHYMWQAIAGNEDELVNMNVVLGIIGLPRSAFDTMLRPLPQCTDEKSKGSKGSMSSRSGYSRSAVSVGSAKKSTMVAQRLYPDIILPPRASKEVYFPPSFPDEAESIKPVSETQRRRWQNRLIKLLHPGGLKIKEK